MAGLKDLSRRTVEDVRHGRHREAYALFLVGVVLVILGLVGVANAAVMLSAILLALTFLVFHTAVEASEQQPSLDKVLLGREEFGPFSKLLPTARELWIYGPTAVNVLAHSGDIRRFVLSPGGTVRVIVGADDPHLLAQAAVQLDDNHDLERTLQSSLGTLAKLAAEPGFSFRRLAVNPGFSLVVVNPGRSDGYVIFESHGFKDENIADRMHIVIRRRDSPRWFAYWVARFEAMWETAGPQPPPAELPGAAPAPVSAGTAAAAARPAEQAVPPSAAESPAAEPPAASR